MSRSTWLLMDMRAAYDPGAAAVLLAGTCEECCAAANRGDYGPGCVVVGPDGEPAWELNADGDWRPERQERSS